jgi:hypothetical protein
MTGDGKAVYGKLESSADGQPRLRFERAEFGPNATAIGPPEGML